MKLLIFGATGGTGIELVKQALEQGHHVTAFARNPDAVAQRHPNLTVVKGDILDAASIDAAVQGHDAVLSALGTKVLKTNTIISDGTRNIIQAMERHGVRRFIVETSLGVGDSDHQMPMAFRVFKNLALKHVFADKEVQERLIQQSALDWIIVRPTGLNDGLRTGRYHHDLSASGKFKTRISRADVADFMLRQLTDDTYLRKTPGLSD